MILTSVIALIAVIIILGAIAFLVDIATFIKDPFKGFVNWLLIAIAVVAVIWFLLGIFGAAPLFTLKS